MAVADFLLPSVFGFLVTQCWVDYEHLHATGHCICRRPSALNQDSTVMGWLLPTFYSWNTPCMAILWATTQGPRCTRAIFMMLRRLDVSPLCLSCTACGRIRGEAWSSWELGTVVNPKISLSKHFCKQYVVQVEGCGHFCGLHAPKCTLLAHPHAGTALHASIYGEPPSYIGTVSKESQCPPKKQGERRRLY